MNILQILSASSSLAKCPGSLSLRVSDPEQLVSKDYLKWWFANGQQKGQELFNMTW